MTPEQFTEAIIRELGRLGLLADGWGQERFIVAQSGDHSVPAVRLTQSWFHADYDAAMLLPILRRMGPAPQGPGERHVHGTVLGFWSAVAPAELWPDNGQKRLRKLTEQSSCKST